MIPRQHSKSSVSGIRGSLHVAVAAFTVAFAVFDMAEAAHQANGSHRGVAVLAALVAVADLAAATVAAVLLRTSPSTSSAATST